MNFDLKIEMEKGNLIVKVFHNQIIIKKLSFQKCWCGIYWNSYFSMSKAQNVGSSPKLESDPEQVCTCMKCLTGSLRTGNMFYLRLTIFDDDEITQSLVCSRKCPRCACVTW